MKTIGSMLTGAAALGIFALFGLTSSAAGDKTKLMNPEALAEMSPAAFKVQVDTSAGMFVVDVKREWAPMGADRFYNLVKHGFYDACRFYRITPQMVQFGIHGDPEVAKAWLGALFDDDPPSAADAYTKVRTPGKPTNTKSFIAFTQSGTNRRSTQLMINLADNSTLDSMITPFGQITSGIDVVASLYNGYGDFAPTGKGPMLTPLYEEGNLYLLREFPKLDYIKTAKIVP